MHKILTCSGPIDSTEVYGTTILNMLDAAAVVSLASRFLQDGVNCFMLN